MATDARISTTLPSHPKMKKLIRRLGPAGAYGLVCLFLWVAGNRSDGDLAGMTDEDIELAIDWSGDNGAFVRELLAIGFLDGDPGQRRVHDWSDHNPWAAGSAKRAEKSKWAALCKQYGRHEAARMMPEYARTVQSNTAESAQGSQDGASGMRDAVPESASRTPEADSGSAPSPSPSPIPIPIPLPTPTSLGTAPDGAAEQSPVDHPWEGMPASVPMSKPSKQPKPRVVETTITEDFAISERVRSWAAEKGHTDLERHLEHFKGKAIAKQYRYVDWDQAFMNAVRDDWAHLGAQYRQTPTGKHNGFDRKDYGLPGELPR
jgi:hypothetical protein